MNDEQLCLSEITRDGEQLCIVRDIYEKVPPACDVCGLLRFCEKPRSEEDIDKLLVEIGRRRFRREYFEQMEDAEYDE